MELQYYIQYILSWVYHNVIHTDATYAVIKIVLFIGLVTLLIYREYVWFVLLCIVILSAEIFRFMKDDKDNNITALQNMLSETSSFNSSAPRIFDKNDLTKGVSLTTREGFPLGMPKIIQGDDSGKDHRRSNKFIEEDSNDFTERYFKSKQCSIGSGIGSISMFGSNELLEGTTRSSVISGIYDFQGKSVPNNDGNGTDAEITSRKRRRYEYFRDCVYEPVYRSSVKDFGDFRKTKTIMFFDINTYIIDIKKCTDRFNTGILFTTNSDISADRSNRVTLSDRKDDNDINTRDNTLVYVSLINGSSNADKMKNIQPLNIGSNGDNASDQTYSRLLHSMSSDERYRNNDALKQQHMNVYSKVFGYRQRIDEILSMMREQTRNDASMLYNVRVSEPIVQELRMILSYLTIIERTNDIIQFETKFPFSGTTGTGIYNVKLDTSTKPSELSAMPIPDNYTTELNKINGDKSILKIPSDDDTYNTNDEKRYLYGITYYFL
jgi:hypothetical protein